MKQGFHISLVFLLFAFLLLSYSISARPLAQPQNQGENQPNKNEVEVKADGIISTFQENKEDFVNLMGSEECADKDEECLKRRMIADAHLDYIYTQNHKPKP